MPVPNLHLYLDRSRGSPPTTTCPQPITYTSPGFWANVMGPESDAVNGDAHSPRCYGGNNCGSPANPANNDYRRFRVHLHPHGADHRRAEQHRLPGVRRRPAIPRSSQSVETGDSVDNSSTFTTDFQMYDADGTPLDMTDNPAMTSAQCGYDDRHSGPNQDPELGPLAARGQRRQRHVQEQLGHALHHQQPDPGRRVRDAGQDRPRHRRHDGGLRLEPVRPAGHRQRRQWQRAAALGLRRHGDLQQHLRRHGHLLPRRRRYQQYEGKTLDVNLWDPGDVGSGTTGRITVVSPDTSGATMTCNWTQQLRSRLRLAPSRWQRLRWHTQRAVQLRRCERIELHHRERHERHQPLQRSVAPHPGHIPPTYACPTPVERCPAAGGRSTTCSPTAVAQHP